jgi:hypothetical protein
MVRLPTSVRTTFTAGAAPLFLNNASVSSSSPSFFPVRIRSSWNSGLSSLPP